MATTQRPLAEDRAGLASRTHRRLRVLAGAALALVLVAVVLPWRLATERVPSLSLRRTLAAYVRLPGGQPVPAWPEEGQAAVAVEGVGTMGSWGAQVPVPIASVAKIMTAYVTLREHPLVEGQSGFEMTVTAVQAAEQKQRVALGQSTLPVRAGEQISERQALQALLLPSANNVAAMLAAHAAGGSAAFVTRMNAMARSLGLHATTYTDPSGFEPTTVSTAGDQLVLARAAMRQPAFAAIVDQRSVELPLAGTVSNYDSLVGEGGYVGIKTGSDRAAGGCFVFAKEISVGRSRVSVLGVVLGQREGSLIPAALSSARRLGDSAAAAVRVVTALPARTSTLTATSADGRHTSIVTARPLQELGWGGLRVPIGVTAAHTGRTRLRAGQAIARVRLDGVGLPSTPAVAVGSLGGPSLGWRLTHLL